MNRQSWEALRGNEALRPHFIAGLFDQIRRLPTNVKEEEFLALVIDVARLLGWRVAHFRPAKTARGWRTPVQGDGEGFPDIFAVRKPTKHRLAVETKVGKNDVSDEQDTWLDAMEACGIPSFTWWPDDIEEIEDVLRNGAI